MAIHSSEYKWTLLHTPCPHAYRQKSSERSCADISAAAAANAAANAATEMVRWGFVEGAAAAWTGFVCFWPGPPSVCTRAQK